jgi:hypothetical protein
MAFEALTLAVASSVHLPDRAGIAEAIIGAFLAAGAFAMVRAPARARTTGIVLNSLAAVGFLNGLTMTARDGDAPGIAYHLAVLPVMIASVIVLARATGETTPDGRAVENIEGELSMTEQTRPSPAAASADRPARATTSVRRASLAAFVLLLVQYGIGMGVNLYVTVPNADHGIGDAISNGPAALSVHAVLGLLLVLAAVGLVVQAAIDGDKVVTAASILGLVAMIAAAAAGASFVDKRGASASMAMAVFTGVGLLAYGFNLYRLNSRTEDGGS